jgi:uncharacterized membrane protein
VATAAEEGIASIEATPEAEDEWLAILWEAGQGLRPLLGRCTPSYGNSEGARTMARPATWCTPATSCATPCHLERWRSGVVELVLGGSLVLLPRYRVVLGWVTAAFFIAIFPGNVSQFVDGDAAFGLDSDVARAVRLAFQPALVVLALWSTGAWAAWRAGAHR